MAFRRFIPMPYSRSTKNSSIWPSNCRRLLVSRIEEETEKSAMAVLLLFKDSLGSTSHLVTIRYSWGTKDEYLFRRICWKVRIPFGSLISISNSSSSVRVAACVNRSSLSHNGWCRLKSPARIVWSSVNFTQLFLYGWPFQSWTHCRCWCWILWLWPIIFFLLFPSYLNIYLHCDSNVSRKWVFRVCWGSLNILTWLVLHDKQLIDCLRILDITK